MNFDNYTERARGFIQSAQSLALRAGHQQFSPEHLLKVLLDAKKGLAAKLMDAAGADHGRALAAVEAELEKRPKVDGGGAGQVYLAAETARLFESAAQIDNQIGHVAQNFLLCSAHKSSPCLVPVGHVNRWLGRVGAALLGGGNTHTHD